MIVETVQLVLVQLGIDNSFFIQFLLFCAFFALIKYSFVNRLLFVISNRESNTSKKISDVEKIREKTHRLLDKFHAAVSSLRKEEFEKMQELEKVYLKKEREAVADTEKWIREFSETSREKFRSEMKDKKKKLEGEVNLLVETIIAKVSK